MADAAVDALLALTVLVEEGRSTSEQNVGNHTYCPDINLHIVVIFPAKFGRHVERASKTKILSLIVIVSGGEAEVGQLDSNLLVVAVGVLLHKDVLRLQVTMHDVLVVHKVESKE